MKKDNTKYIDVFPRIFKEIIENVNSQIKKLQTGNVPNNFIDRYYDMLSLGFKDIGIGELVINADVVKFKEYFYRAAKLQEILFQKYDNKSLKISPSLWL